MFYGREIKADADIAKVLTMDEARRIASNCSSLIANCELKLFVLTFTTLVDESEDISRGPQPFETVIDGPDAIGLWQSIDETLNEGIGRAALLRAT